MSKSFNDQARERFQEQREANRARQALERKAEKRTRRVEYDALYDEDGDADSYYHDER